MSEHRYLRHRDASSSPPPTQSPTVVDWDQAWEKWAAQHPNPYNQNLTVFNTTATTTTYFGYEDPTAGLSAFLLGCFFMFFVCWCSISTVPGEEHRRFAILREQARREKKKMEDPDERRECIRHSLTVKYIVSADAGALTLAEMQFVAGEEPQEEDEQSDDNSLAGDSCSSGNNETSTCVICLEQFLIGDVVAWSKQDEEETEPCLHVFHKACITQWLQDARHDDCPSCRKQILHFDKVTKKIESIDEDEEGISFNDEDDQLSDASTPHGGLFVIMRGMVSTAARQASYSLIGQSIDATVAGEYSVEEEERGKPQIRHAH
jgi:hypothetical protein